MTLRCVIFLVVVFSVPPLLWAQPKNLFQLPAGVSAADYEPGRVWVKLTGDHRNLFDGGTKAGRLPNLLAGTQAKPLLPLPAREKANGRLGPRKQQVDLSLYYAVSFDPGRELVDYINELYATGYFEVVEPVYTILPFLVPDDPSISQQYYLDLVHAQEAWDITTADPSIIIGIVDTGGDLDHPDLQANLYIDPAEPIDGVDNDGDGFVDNNRGWDFSGADLALIGTPGFIGDNDPSISQGNVFSHGTMVAGCASAATNNGVGISGIGYNAKLLFTKHFADNQSASGTNYSSNLYQGILYAATHGAKIINCSWGGYNRSTIAQDIIKYVTLDLGCLVIAAAGNSNLETPIYPAGYDYVLSVASCDAADIRAPYSNFGKTIDITSPGRYIFTTTYDNDYTTESGTSLAAPIVSGAAALVWTQNPTFTPLQVAEQLRVSADESIYANNPGYEYKLGRGRLDALRALTVKSPSIRANHQQLVKGDGSKPGAGEDGNLYFDFTNYLEPSSPALTATLSTSSPYITITSDQFVLGSIGENTTVRNTGAPFELLLAPGFPVDEPVEALLTFTDGEYNDFQLVSFIIPSYIDIDENNIITSLTSSGRVGFGNVPEQRAGSGFIYDEEGMLYEMGLIMGTSDSWLFNNVRGNNGNFEQDFTPTVDLVEQKPGTRSNAEVIGHLRNDPDVANASLDISYQSLVWEDEPYRDFVILEYTIRNTTADPLTDFYVGIFADWDIASAGSGDRAAWDNDTRLGYVFPAQSAILPRAGVQALTGTAQYYAIDNDHTMAGNPWGIYDDFTDTEKYMSISSGLTKTQAGDPTTGSDVSHVVSSGPFTINPGEAITLAFALHAAKSQAALITSAKYADSLYNYTLKAPQPWVDAVEVCAENTASLAASGATSFNWYRAFTGGEPIFSGDVFVTESLLHDTVFFVSNADASYESLRTRVPVTVLPIPAIFSSGNLEFCEGESVVLSTEAAEEYTWNTGEKTQSISVSTSGEFSALVRNNTTTCETPTITTLANPRPSPVFTVTPEAPAPNEEISFFSAEQNAVSWNWDFGNGGTSDAPQPIYSYPAEGEHTVTLTVTTDKGCQDSASKTFGIVTEAEGPSSNHISIFPNPVSQTLHIEIPANHTAKMILFDGQGNRVLQAQFESDTQLDLSRLAEGMYFLKVTTPERELIRKVVVLR